jgi:hypothetical protein
MGYYVRYRLDVIGADHGEVTTELEDIVGHDVLEEPQSQWGLECNAHMLRLAQRFPDAVLILHAEGAESGDVARTYFKHGQKPVEQRAALVFPDPPPQWSQS